MSRVIALLRASHPAPGLAVTTITIVFAASAGLELWRIVVMGFAAWLNQTAVGLSNDWLDHERDRASGRTTKPLVSGVVDRRWVGIVALVCLCLCLVLPLALGWICALAHLVAVASGLAYNARLKATVLSPLPYAVSFALLPVVVCLASPVPALPQPTIVLAAALLGVAAHFGNALPDIADDQRTGIWGLPQRLSTAQCGAILVVSMYSGVLTALLTAAEANLVVAGVGIAVGTALAVATAVALRRNPQSRAIFGATIASALLCVVGLSVSLSSVNP